MTDTIHAVVTRNGGINHAEQNYPQGAVIEDMPVGQFGEWQALRIVDKASDEQVQKSRDEAAAIAAEHAERERKSAEKAAPKKARTEPKATKPA